MTLLVISPDFISHYRPLAAVARVAKLAGNRVVFATGKNMAPYVEAEGFEWTLLSLSETSNSGIAKQNPSIKRFLDATKEGPIATLRCQALDREADLLWQPIAVAKRIAEICESLDPDDILVDQVSFGSTLGVYATGRPFTTLVPGHPSQLPVGTEHYGMPAIWPQSILPEPRELDELAAITDRVAKAFTHNWNQALAAVAPHRQPVDNAFRVHGQQVLYNSSATYCAPERLPLLPKNHQFVGPLVREETLTEDTQRWLDHGEGVPKIYVAFGTFLSHRSDVLQTIAQALKLIDARVAMAIGANDKALFEPTPAGWLVASSLPQVGLLSGCDLVIHHGGNNSVQEALAMGVRQIIMPFSTDQFANAADLERVDQCQVFSPNHIQPQELANTIKSQLALPKPKKVASPSIKGAGLGCFALT
jgi:UDP:flavonoid glycosyltransferase YjiC (YdhE family)